jgi:hypothetical protein
MDRILHRGACFYQGVLIQHQSYHGDYVCPHGGVTVSVSDGMDCSTQVSPARSMWVHVVLSYHARDSMLLPFMRWAPISFPGAKSPRVWLPRAQVRSQPGYEEGP